MRQKSISVRKETISASENSVKAVARIVLKQLGLNDNRVYDVRLESRSWYDDKSHQNGIKKIYNVYYDGKLGGQVIKKISNLISEKLNIEPTSIFMVGIRN